MSLHRLIEGAAFDAETVKLLAQAYEGAVSRVGPHQPMLVLETIAGRIIDSATAGERDPQKMIEYAIRGIAHSA